MDYVSFPVVICAFFESDEGVLLKKNLPKVTAPGKLIYVDDGEFVFSRKMDTNA